MDLNDQSNYISSKAQHTSVHNKQLESIPKTIQIYDFQNGQVNTSHHDIIMIKETPSPSWHLESNIGTTDWWLKVVKQSVSYTNYKYNHTQHRANQCITLVGFKRSISTTFTSNHIYEYLKPLVDILTGQKLVNPKGKLKTISIKITKWKHISLMEMHG